MQFSIKSRYTVTLDDDPAIPRIIEKATGIPSIACASEESLMREIHHLRPMAIFVDIHLGVAPRSGLELLPTLRAKLPYCPILVITSLLEGEHIERALRLGADDFVRKPIQAAELSSRLQARVRDQLRKQERSTVRCADISIDTERGVLHGQGREASPSPIAMRVLIRLVEAKGITVAREGLKQAGWGDVKVSDNALDQKVHELRKLLRETSASLAIENRYAEGFRLGARSAKIR